MTPQQYIDFARHFVGAIQSGDADTVRACYAPDAEIWHNNDGTVQTVDQNMKVLAWFMRVLKDRNYRVTRLEALSDGFVQQHVLEATLPDGTAWALDACVIVKMENGVITRLDEYLDSAQTAALAGLGRSAA